jgi:predicted metalloprotease with PDZ domain
MAYGGGLDVRLSDHFSIRIAQADYLYTKHDFSLGASGVARHQNNLRVSAGLVVTFGGRQDESTLPRSSQIDRGAKGMQIPVLGLQAFSREDMAGAEISEVVPGSVAEHASLRVGDVINSVDGKSVTTPMELTDELSKRAPGVAVKLGFLRRGYWQTETTLILPANK